MNSEIFAKIEVLEELKEELKMTLFGRDITEYRAGGFDATNSIISRIDNRISILKKVNC